MNPWICSIWRKKTLFFKPGNESSRKGSDFMSIAYKTSKHILFRPTNDFVSLNGPIDHVNGRIRNDCKVKISFGIPLSVGIYVMEFLVLKQEWVSDLEKNIEEEKERHNPIECDEIVYPPGWIYVGDVMRWCVYWFSGFNLNTLLVWKW